MKITSAFDGGNIRCLTHDSAANITLEIEKDQNSEFFQWFYFRLVGSRGESYRLRIINAGKAAYPEGWKNYRAVASYDRKNWFRVQTDFDGNVLEIYHQITKDSIYFAYFAPYTMEQHQDLITRCIQHSKVSLKVVGNSLDGVNIDLLSIGEDKRKKLKIWIIARQHPGETMAQWFIDGFLKRLLNTNDAISRAALDKAMFLIVPNMNPDGSRRGHLRTNAAGINLNREWNDPSQHRSPEVFWVREYMQRIGVDFCMDVHGDEAIPYNFIAGTEGIPSFTKHQKLLLNEYKAKLAQSNPDFQVKAGYPVNSPGNANLSICANWVAQNFDCLSMTLEQPFKDLGDEEINDEGWSPARSSLLGSSNLDAIYAVLQKLR